MSEATFQHGDGCCECNCTSGELGVGGCLFTVWVLKLLCSSVRLMQVFWLASFYQGVAPALPFAPQVSVQLLNPRQYSVHCTNFYASAKDAGLKNGELYCLMPFCGFTCCAFMFLGQDVEEKRGLKSHSGGWVSFPFVFTSHSRSIFSHLQCTIMFYVTACHACLFRELLLLFLPCHQRV